MGYKRLPPAQSSPAPNASLAADFDAITGLWQNLGAAVAYIGSAYLVPFQRCHCHCPEAVVDPGLLGIVRGQLNRCGPERLSPVCPPCHCNFTGLPEPATYKFFIVFFAGILVGVIFAIIFFKRREHLKEHQVAPTSRPAPSSRPSITGLSPSSLRSLKDGSSHS